MVAESYQIGFPESSLPERTLKAGTKERAPKPRSKDKGARYITLREGVNFRTGPIGKTGQWAFQADQPIVGRILGTDSFDGMLNFKIEIESPPELKGRRYWVTRMTPKKGSPFI